MSAGQLAALIAAVSFAVLAAVSVVVLIKLSGVLSTAKRLMIDYSGRADLLLDRAQAAVDRTNEQLARTDSITASMDQVTANMAELSGHVSALTGLARAMSAAVSTPVTGLAALVHGVRRAVIVRRSMQAATLAGQQRGRAAVLADPVTRAAISTATGPVAAPEMRSVPSPRAQLTGPR
jgi:uncharacterized protein YoxC